MQAIVVIQSMWEVGKLYAVKDAESIGAGIGAGIRAGYALRIMVS